MKKIINIALIAILVFSSVPVSPAITKAERSTDKLVSLYLADSEEDLMLYEDEALEEELVSVENNSPAQLLDVIEAEDISLVEIETNEEEVIQGYIHSDAVIDYEEYKLYAEEETSDIPIYIDETLEEPFYELTDGTSVLVNEIDLETEDYVHISLNPEVETIPEELKDDVDNVEDITGFVEKNHLVALDAEEEFLLERENEAQEAAENDEQNSTDNEADENENEATEELEEETEKPKAEETEKPKAEETEEETVDESEKAEPAEQDEAESEEADEAVETEEENKEISMFASKVQESNTSRLGHIRGGNRLIHKSIGGKTVKATSKHRNTVYYIKRQAKVGSETYYLLSTQPSSTKGVIGWMKAKDISTHSHSGVSKKSKQLLLNGKGKATSKAWGGSKDSVHASLSNFKENTLYVNLTEKVGKNTWYRGKINNSGKNVWVHSSQTEAKPTVKESKTSKLGHIRGGNRFIHKSIGGKTVKVTSKHRDSVYYIKKKATFGSDTYYLLSTQPTAKKGVIGWMKAKDISTHNHSGVSKKSKEFLIKGTGKATSKAWGGSKDIVHKSMKSHEGEFLHVNLTEKVGKNTWYRGKINGKGSNVWLHISDVESFDIKKSNTSRLGHIRGGNRLIYKELGANSIKASAKYQDTVYYIKQKATLSSETFYLISTQPSKTKGVIGWVNADDLSTHSHSGVTKKSQQMAIKGTGKATSKAWGGNKDVIHSSMKSFKGEIFDVNLTEKVGKNTWYRGKVKNKGKNVWLHSSQVIKDAVVETNYGLSLNKAVNIQMDRRPFKMNGSHAFVAKSQVKANNTMKSGSTNVRTMPTTTANYDNKIIKKLKGGTKIKPIAEIGGWYAIEVGGSRKVAALPKQVKQSLNPVSHLSDSVNKFQFLNLRKRTGLTTKEMNRELKTRGILKGEGKAFRDASIKHGVNEMYLIVHARLETGNGTSALSNGTHEVGLDKNGKAQLVQSAADRVKLTNIKKTYNMFGIGAIDSNPAVGGATRAYEEGWFTPEAAIVGGAAWIKENYIYNQFNQNTLYKMRWNPEMVNGKAWKQYATDIDWAIKQAKLIHGVYNQTNKDKVLSFDTPVYK